MRRGEERRGEERRGGEGRRVQFLLQVRSLVKASRDVPTLAEF